MHLQTLDISGTEIGPHDLKHLSVLTALSSLNIGNRIYDHLTRSLLSTIEEVQCLMPLTALTRLDIKYRTPEGVRLLSNLPNLTGIHMMSDADDDHMEALSHCTSLESIYIGFAPFLTDLGACSVINETSLFAIAHEIEGSSLTWLLLILLQSNRYSLCNLDSVSKCANPLSES